MESQETSVEIEDRGRLKWELPDNVLKPPEDNVLVTYALKFHRPHRVDELEERLAESSLNETGTSADCWMQPSARACFRLQRWLW